jgi:hypothetical protein
MYILIFVLFLCPVLSAQVTAGTGQAALCNSSASVSDDVFSLFGNPAGLAQIQWRETGVYYSPAPFGLTELVYYGIAHNEPAFSGSVSAGVVTYGYDLYKENKFLLSYSRQVISGIYIGTALNYQHVSIHNYGSDGALYFNLGTITSLTPELRFGFSIKNLNNASLGNEKDQIPLLLDMGFSYNYSDILSLYAAVNKDIRYKPGFAGGIEYVLRDVLTIRSGIGSEPFRYSAGIGLHISRFTFDYAFSLHRELGVTHQISLMFSFIEYDNRSRAIREYGEKR